MDNFSKERLAERQSKEVSNLLGRCGETVIEDRIYQAAEKIKNIQFQIYSVDSMSPEADRLLQETCAILSQFDDMGRVRVLAQATFSNHKDMTLNRIKEDLNSKRYRKINIWDVDMVHAKGISN